MTGGTVRVKEAQILTSTLQRGGGRERERQRERVSERVSKQGGGGKGWVGYEHVSACVIEPGENTQKNGGCSLNGFRSSPPLH